ncbi:hypothetical protein [Lactococcus sp.]|uniref:hypothetical protein n=1 Tax=Lactococcus sp. TaxID=44273 RepID=UPI0035B42511
MGIDVKINGEVILPIELEETCQIHGCHLIGRTEPVWAYDSHDVKGYGIGGHWYTPKVCPQCFGKPAETVTKLSALAEFKHKKGIDLKKDVIVKYSFSDELSVVATDNMKSWITQKVGREIKVKLINTRKYCEQLKNRFMSDEEKQKYLKLSHEIELADLIIIDSLADFSETQEEDIYNMMLTCKDNSSFMILTIPESEQRLDDMPIKLKHRLKSAQIMEMNSKGA